MMLVDASPARCAALLGLSTQTPHQTLVVIGSCLECATTEQHMISSRYRQLTNMQFYVAAS